ncbi:PLP-dependent transferase [Pterulicium gracile]|uniref:PLP-dependent transferase n=1 Tax=Pterulicium gracile TaxID=1884261 RepID=A0A5C3QPP2_9AGAR|nr:PLP-dependent transferase [Pterula gracilis]
MAGAYGGLAKPVRDYYEEITARIESNPELFMRFHSGPLSADVRERIAGFIGAEADECVLVTNATMAVTTIMKNFMWHAEDVIITLGTSYTSINTTAQSLHDIHPHPSHRVFQLNFPTTHAEIITSFRTFIQSLAKTTPDSDQDVKSGPTTGTGKIVAIIDSICSLPGVLLPWQEMVKTCAEYGVWSVLDAAHSLGQEPNINLTESRPDFWFSNAHKWLVSKRACAVMYVPRRNQHIIKTVLPTAHIYPGTLVQQCEWTGTIDWGLYLSVGAALDFRQWIGGEEKIFAYCHDLALRGSTRVAEILGTRTLDETPNRELTLNMADVILPISSSVPGSPEVALALKKKMIIDRKVSASSHYHNGKWMVRCCAQIYNEMEDFEKLGRLYLEACQEIEEQFRTAT